LCATAKSDLDARRLDRAAADRGRRLLLALDGRRRHDRYDARVAPDGLRVAYWFTRHRRFCLPLEPGCSVQDTDVTAYGYAGRVTDPLELGVVRERRQPSWYGAGRALVFRHDPGTGETVSVNRVGGGEADDQGWFSYDDGTSLEQGQLDHGGTRLAADRARAGEGDDDRPAPRQLARLTPPVRPA
jgi:hypothetical protein